MAAWAVELAAAVVVAAAVAVDSAAASWHAAGTAMAMVVETGMVAVASRGTESGRLRAPRAD